MAISAFSGNYFEARSRFRAAAAQRKLHLQAYSIAYAGAAEGLTIDVACSEGDTSRPTLVLSSGIHGVEGFFGSAVQLDLLENSMEDAWPGNRLRLVLIHALNPFGFANLRRVDADNVDINRNLLLDGERYQGRVRIYLTQRLVGSYLGWKC